jgi:hypothetical protein
MRTGQAGPQPERRHTDLVGGAGIEPTSGLGVNQLQAKFCYPPNLVYGAGLEPALRGYRPRFLPIGRPVEIGSGYRNRTCLISG